MASKSPVRKAKSSRSPQPAATFTWILPKGSSSKRIKAMLLVTAILISALAGRALQIQAFDSQAYATQAAERMTMSRVIVPSRGVISDRNGVVLAESQPAVKVIADPYQIHYNGANPDNMTKKQRAKADEAPAAIAGALVKYLGGKPDDYLEKLTATDKEGNFSKYQVIARHVPAYTYTQLSKELREGGWYGITREADPTRAYPTGTIASNVVGFIDGEGKGAAGLEYYLDETLSGKPGREVYENSAYGRIPLGNTVLTPAENGTDYTVTIDSDLQWMAEKLVAQKVKDAGAATGRAIVMDVKSGEVLAMANYPSFDSNAPAKAESADLGNRVVASVYEPGSVQKVITMAALADMGLVTADTRVEVPPQVLSGGSYIRDVFSHPTLHMTARGVIAQSSNIGTVLLARQADKAKYAEYLKDFGFGAPTGVGLPGEAAGKSPDQGMPDYLRDQTSFGQGISVTAIQEAAAVAAIANKGVYNDPVILKSAKDGEGRPVALPDRQPRRVISEEAADEVLDMMEAVVHSPKFEKQRAIQGYRMAGKSGTAERYDPKTGRYNGYTASFIGVAPVADPQILAYVVIDQPTRGNAGSELALPVVRELMQLALPRYGVAPETSVPKYTRPLTYEP